MEELDKIILDSLRGLNCSLDDEITSLKDFDANTTLLALSTCLEAIKPTLKVPKKLPTSLSAKMKTALTVAHQIKELGFKGDMGYQSILYFNEIEIRRVLIFLIERLPNSNTIVGHQVENTGYVPRIVKQIEEALAEAMRQGWLPSEIIQKGARQVSSENMMVTSFGESCPLDYVDLIVPDSSLNSHQYIPDVTKQCKTSQLIPSLLFEGCHTILEPNKLKPMDERPVVSISSLQDITQLNKYSIIQDCSEDSTQTTEQLEKRNKLEALYQEIKEGKEKYFSTQELVNKLEANLKKIRNVKSTEQETLESLVKNVKLKKKTNTALSNNENIAKLKDLIDTANERLGELQTQWDEVQTPLLAERRSLQSMVNSEASKFDSVQNKLSKTRQTYTDLVQDYKDKIILEQTLAEKCKELSKKNNRAVYTRRILEIVGNIKKQNTEIQKVLSDTRQIQKEINNLTGQVERSFILSEELIFQDASQERTNGIAKTCYKLVVMLRDEYEKILTAVSDFGQAERETRNLEEQVELEKGKDTKVKLDKITQDLAEIKKEIQMLSVNHN